MSGVGEHLLFSFQFSSKPHSSYWSPNLYICVAYPGPVGIWACGPSSEGNRETEHFQNYY